MTADSDINVVALNHFKMQANMLQSRIELMRSHFTSNIRFCEELITHSTDPIIVQASKDRLEICERAFEQMYGFNYREWYEKFDGRKPHEASNA